MTKNTIKEIVEDNVRCDHCGYLYPISEILVMDRKYKLDRKYIGYGINILCSECYGK